MFEPRQALKAGRGVEATGTWQQVIMHEVAHALGIAHKSDTKQIMAPTYNKTLTQFGAGDRNALRLQGLHVADDNPTRVYGQPADSCA